MEATEAKRISMCTQQGYFGDLDICFMMENKKGGKKKEKEAKEIILKDGVVPSGSGTSIILSAGPLTDCRGKGKQSKQTR